MEFNWEEIKKKALTAKEKAIDIATRASKKAETLTEKARDKFEEKITEDSFSIENKEELDTLLKENKKVAILFIDKDIEESEKIIYKAPYYATKAWTKAIKFKIIEKNKSESKEFIDLYKIEKFPTLINLSESKEVARFENIEDIEANLSDMEF